MPKPIHLIAACSDNLVIGRNGSLPWAIPEDTHFFQEKTRHQTVIMGSRSFTEWPSCVQERDVVVITQATQRSANNVRFAPSLAEAIEIGQSLRGELYLCGGQRVYEEGLAIGDYLHLTLVHTLIESGDTFFPDWRKHFTREIARRESSDKQWRYTFLTLARAA